MKNKIHNLSLKGITGISLGVISIIFIFGVHIVLLQYASGSGSVAMLPISFFEILIISISVLYILISYFTVTLINRKRRRARYLRKWDFKAKKIRRVYLVFLFIGAVMLYFLMTYGQIKLVIPASLILYGIAGIITNDNTCGATAILGIVFLVLGVFAILFPSLAFYLWGFAFGVCHIIYGFVYFKNIR